MSNHGEKHDGLGFSSLHTESHANFDAGAFIRQEGRQPMRVMTRARRQEELRRVRDVLGVPGLDTRSIVVPAKMERERASTAWMGWLTGRGGMSQ